MTAIHQLVVSASPGDAITDTTLATREVLMAVGPSRIGARYWDPALHGQIVSLDGLRDAAAPGDALLYHASIGEPGMVEYVRDWDGPVVLQYHNMTPASYFHGVDEILAGRLEEGRLELEQLVTRVDAALAVSGFNASELAAVGYADVRVVPLLMEVKSLVDTTPSASTMHHFDVHPGPVLFFLGQLLPHKRPDLLLRAYHLLITYHRPDAHLVLAGPPRLAAYANHLSRMIFELNMPRCWLTGRVERDELAAFYRRATAFVTASEHEGFCLPLIEAMGFGVPIIARACTAIPETLDGAGLMLPPDDDPAMLCEAMLEMIENAELRTELVQAGHERLDRLNPDAAGDLLLEALAELL